MIELKLPPAAEHYAKNLKREQDRAGLGDQFRVPGADKRWTGHAVEYTLDKYFTELGLPHVWNGGLDDKPDFEINRLGVASKANSGPQASEDFTFVIPKNQIGRLADVALFSIISPRAGKVWIMGTMHSHNFRDFAELRRKGEEGFIPGRPLYADCWGIRASSLGDPETFFKMLEVSNAA